MLRQFAAQQWFLIALAAVLAIGFIFPVTLHSFAELTWVRNGIVATVLFLMALPLPTSTVMATLRRPGAALLGSLVNMGVVPILAWGLALLSTGDLATGILIAAAAPCTLASAAVWTRRGGGNGAVAILVTLLTNGTCFVLTPLWLLATTGTATEIGLADMIGKLGLLVVLPMVVAQGLRLAPTIAEFATRRTSELSTIAQLGILTMVLIGAVKSSEGLSQTRWQDAVGLLDFLVMGVLVVALHLISLWIGWTLAGFSRMNRGDRIAVAMAGSQKTLMVGLFVAINYFSGLTVLPMVAYHVGQLFTDTIIADIWRKQGKRSESA